jgi:cysteine desulfurase
MKRIYLDHNATTPPHPLVIEAMTPYCRDIFGNPSSVHTFGQQTRKGVEEAREKVAALIGADPREIVFTSSGTESDNLALQGIARAHGKRGKHIITSSIEHPAVLRTCQCLEEEGFRVTYLPVSQDGLVDPDSVQAHIGEDTILVSIMHANNEVGTIQPLERIGVLTRERDIFFHTDAVQSVGKIPVNVCDLEVDLLSLSAHKFYGPKGAGALYVRRGTRLAPLLRGGHHEHNLRAGTENVPAVVGLGKAAEIAACEMEGWASSVSRLTSRLEKGILSRITHTGINGHAKRRLPHVSNISFEYVEGESLLLRLDLQGMACASGSACTSGAIEPSHVLKAMGIPPTRAHSAIRISLGRENTEEEIDYVLEALEEIVGDLRSMSPVFSQQTASQRG